jgi:hypothetical protein
LSNIALIPTIKEDIIAAQRTDVGLLRWVDCDILAQGLIGLIEYSYHQGIASFLEAQLKRTLGLSVLGSPTEKNSRVKGAWPKVISGWVTDWEVFLGAHK